MFRCNCYDRAAGLLFWLLLLPNKEGSWVLGFEGSVAKILGYWLGLGVPASRARARAGVPARARARTRGNG